MEVWTEKSDTEGMLEYRVGLLGLGTVGASYAELLTRFGADCSRSCGRTLELRRIAVRDLDRARAKLGNRGDAELTLDVNDIIGAEDIDLVVELVGGVDSPREWIRRAIESGQDVVTANKAVLAAHGEELFALAHKHGTTLLFEGAVAGAIPILQVIREGLTAGPITALTAILNGSSNWLLGALENGDSFEDALKEAGRLGLVEADPTLDISGQDAAHKLALIARLLTGRRVDLDSIRCDGIESIDSEDLAFGRRHGLTLKLAAIMRTPHAQHHGGTVSLGVFPMWLSASHPLAGVREENNAVLLEGPTFDSLMFQGKGAGGHPTAGSVIADTVRAARGAGKISAATDRLEVLDPLADLARYYVRLTVPDAPGVLARIASAFAEQSVSLASVEQVERRESNAAMIHMITHRTTAANIDTALAALGKETLPSQAPVRIAIAVDGWQTEGDTATRTSDASDGNRT